MIKVTIKVKYTNRADEFNIQAFFWSIS